MYLFTRKRTEVINKGVIGTTLTWIPSPRYLQNHIDLVSVLLEPFSFKVLPDPTPGPHVITEPYGLGFRFSCDHGTILTWIPSPRYLQDHIDLDSVLLEPFSLEVLLDPTSDPTSDPISDPTFDPISDPTSDPTSESTSDPTSDPTQLMVYSVSPVVSPVTCAFLAS